jgi:D-psicose/D-tagatose/L-ribulose 3-epimerase
MAAPLRFSICNEVFGDTPFAASCATTKKIGYDGIEIAPFTLAEDPAKIPAHRQREFRQIMADHELRFVGLHWLMAAPKGLHVTTADRGLRQRSWEHVRHLIDLSAALATPGAKEPPVMVFGSPQQRNAIGEMTPQEATQVFTEELARVAPRAEAAGVRILVEALPRNQSNIINLLDEAVAVVEQIGSPAVGTMFDTHNAVDETEPHADLIRRRIGYIDHVHVNEIDGREPGTGSYDFSSILNVLIEMGYAGWISLEVFDFARGAEVIARGSLEYLKGICPGAPIWPPMNADERG